MLAANFNTLFPEPRETMFSVVSTDSSDSSESLVSPFPAAVHSEVSDVHLIPSLRKARFPRLSLYIGFVGGLTASAVRISSSVAADPPRPVVTPVFSDRSGSVLLSD